MLWFQAVLDEGEEGRCVRLEGSRDGRSPDVCQVQGGPGGLHELEEGLLGADSVTKQLCEGSLEDLQGCQDVMPASHPEDLSAKKLL